MVGRRLLRVRDAIINPNERTVTLDLDRDVSYYDHLRITYKDLVGDQVDGGVQDSFGNDLRSLNEFKVKIAMRDQKEDHLTVLLVSGRPRN